MKILGINAVFHDPAAALVVDGEIVAAAEEERFSRRKHGKSPVPFSTWELPERAAHWCLEAAGLLPDQLDVVTYSYDPSLAPSLDGDVTSAQWEGLRTLFARRAGHFLAAALSGFDHERLSHVPHHVCHAASAYLAGPFRDGAVITVDGRGERATHLSGRVVDGALEVLATSEMPHSLGMVYEELTAHLGFRRSSDEYKVMALAAYGRPAHLDAMRDLIRVTDAGTLDIDPVDWARYADPVPRGGEELLTESHGDLAASVQQRLEEVLLELARWVYEHTDEVALYLAGGVALNCVANTRLWREGPFRDIWVQPAAGDAGTALGGALYAAHRGGDAIKPMTTAALGRGFGDDTVAAAFREARVPFHRPDDVADEVAKELSHDRIVAWFQGRSEWGPRALGNRSLLADPRPEVNLDRINAIKGRERFRPVAPMVLAEAASTVFDGPLPSPYMLFTHDVRPEWRGRIPAVTHVDGTARVQTVHRDEEPLLHSMITRFADMTGIPVVVNTSLNTAGRPIVDDPRDLLECFASAPIDTVAAGSLLVRRGDLFEGGDGA